MVEYIETGLFDSKGKEIEANDIVTFEYGYGIVYWDKTTASFKIKFDTDSDDLWLYCCNNSDIEVVGEYKDDSINTMYDVIKNMNENTCN